MVRCYQCALCQRKVAFHVRLFKNIALKSTHSQYIDEEKDVYNASLQLVAGKMSKMRGLLVGNFEKVPESCLMGVAQMDFYF